MPCHASSADSPRAVMRSTHKRARASSQAPTHLSRHLLRPHRILRSSSSDAHRTIHNPHTSTRRGVAADTISWQLPICLRRQILKPLPSFDECALRIQGLARCRQVVGGVCTRCHTSVCVSGGGVLIQGVGCSRAAARWGGVTRCHTSVCGSGGGVLIQGVGCSGAPARWWVWWCRTSACVRRWCHRAVALLARRILHGLAG